jgi:hypothetical protein
MAYEKVYLAGFNSQTLDDIEVSFYKKNIALTLTPLEVANAIAETIENTPDSAFTIPEPPILSLPTVTVSQYKDGTNYKIDFIVGGTVQAGNVYAIRFFHPVWGADDYNVDVQYTSTASDTNSTIAQKLRDLVVANTNDAPIVLHLVGNTLTVENSQDTPEAYDFDNVFGSAIPPPAIQRPHAYPYIAIPFTNQYKNNTFVLVVHKDYTPSFLAEANGAGNNPTIQVVYTLPQGNYKWYYVQIGEDILPDNSYTVTVQGATIEFTVSDAVGEVQPIVLKDIKIKKHGETDLFTCIRPTELIMTINMKPEHSYDYSTFLVDEYDEWQISVDNIGGNRFKGYMLPEEGKTAFKDKPYEVTLIATDGYALMKDADFVDLDGQPFSQCGDMLYSKIYLLACALKATGLDLPIRTFCSIYNDSMIDRFGDITADYFEQAQLSIKTFLKDADNFVSCWEAIEIMLENNFTLYQSEGMNIIHRVDEFRNIVTEQGDYYTDYDSEGVKIGGNQILHTPCRVGRNQKIQPVDLPERWSELHVKSVTTAYDYEVFPQLVPNQNLTQLGGQLEVIIDGNRPGNEPSVAYDIVCWGQFHGAIYAESPINNEPASIRVDRNSNEFETARFYVVKSDATASAADLKGNYVRNLNNDFYVEEGDKLNISVDWKCTVAESHPTQFRILTVYLLKEGGTWSNSADWYTLKPDGTWVNNAFNSAGIHNANDMSNGDYTQVWQQSSGSGETVVPENGTIYIALSASSKSGVSANNEFHFRNLTVELTKTNNNFFPRIAVQNPTRKVYHTQSIIKNDYWISSQNKNIKDKIEQRVRISDCLSKAIKGALYNSSGELTSTKWYRQGLETETYHFKELQNLAMFQQRYQRREKVSGQFKGINYSPDNDANNLSPLAFHQRFILEDFSETKIWALAPPLIFDLKTGIIEANFIEVNTEAEYKGDEHKYKHNL